ncbi:MAG: rhodanese-like domain-containing protein [Ilumatobacteraceae bacterium]|nr:rhodanese-like domain-containing protein [Ilumatobacteraceae bacterium]
MTSSRALLAVVLTAATTLAACGGNDTGAETAPADSTATVQGNDTDVADIRVVAPEVAARTIADAPDDLVILDVRTREEFDDGHIEGAVMLDFYRDDFADELAKFDPTRPYVLYCRSGNRSSQARAIMADLGFESVEDIDGGIVGWQEAGLPVVTASG